MKRLEEYIRDNYIFLFTLGFYINKSIFEKSYSSTILKHDNLPLMFCFMLEKNIVNVAVSTQTIMDSGDYSKFDKYYDLFYITKLLEPKIEYSNINPSIYPHVIENFFDVLISIFDDKYIKETVVRINKIMKEYDKIRWKN